MRHEVKWEDTRLMLDGTERQMPYVINRAWRISDAVLILFDPDTPLTSIHPEQLIPPCADEMLAPAFKNVALASLDGNIIWWSEIHPHLGRDRYVSLTSLDPIQLRTISRYEALLSFATGKVEKERDVQKRQAQPWFPSEWARTAGRRKDWESCWFLGSRVFRTHAATLEIDGNVVQAFESDQIMLVLYTDTSNRKSRAWSNIQAFGAANETLWTAEAFNIGYTGPIYYRITCLDPVVAYTGSHFCLVDLESGRVLDSLFTK